MLIFYSVKAALYLGRIISENNWDHKTFLIFLWFLSAMCAGSTWQKCFACYIYNKGDKKKYIPK